MKEARRGPIQSQKLPQSKEQEQRAIYEIGRHDPHLRPFRSRSPREVPSQPTDQLSYYFHGEVPSSVRAGDRFQLGREQISLTIRDEWKGT